MPIAYWAGSPVIEAYKNGVLMKEVVEARQGMATTNNDRFVRLWHEVDRADICFRPLQLRQKTQDENGFHITRVGKDDSGMVTMILSSTGKMMDVR